LEQAVKDKNLCGFFILAWIIHGDWMKGEK